MNVPKLELGEGPHWDIKTQTLYYVDLIGRKINCYKYHENRAYSAVIGVLIHTSLRTKIILNINYNYSTDYEKYSDDIGFIIPIKGRPNEFVIGLGPKVVRIIWDSVSPKFTVIEELVDTEPGLGQQSVNRMNDAKADHIGRLYFGTMNRNVEGRTSSFYSKYKNEPITRIRDNVGISNGITWDHSLQKMYYVDTFNEKVEVLDYNIKSGRVGWYYQLSH